MGIAMADELDRAAALADYEREVVVLNHSRRAEEPARDECLDCGCEIPLQRRLAHPRACRCIHCQTSYEARIQRVGKAL